MKFPRPAGVLLASLLLVQLSPARAESAEALTISRERYAERLAGFWLGSCVANWTGLITEMDRVEAPFYTDADWGQPDQPNMWGGAGPADTIDFLLVRAGTAWGADDDTDIEYLYQSLMEASADPLLTGEQIRDGWLAHMWSDNFNQDGENFLWVSNERAYELMRTAGLVPPATSDPQHNPESEMIDAQLTTEFFGFFAPGRPVMARRLADLPIRTTASGEAQVIAEFYVTMYALAATMDDAAPLGPQLRAAATTARGVLPAGSVAADMYDFVWAAYQKNPDSAAWAATRDALYEEYQLGGRAGYVYAQPFDAPINFGASLVSLFYGDGDFKRTIQIGSLAGWDSDNPTATWGGLIGFVLGRDGVKRAMAAPDLSDSYRISRTRRGFPDHTPDGPGEDTFTLLAERGLTIVDRVVTRYLSGTVDEAANVWRIPAAPAQVSAQSSDER
ncbi:ADP-ribosylglycohydrolase family protein [Actomonas aquatica]|uniref:ADP-ribosylglycohydrolase family protein n=1 Tax=Actomonas aquatica TaxID=2866162 RepID=A0ABZ1C379_9BACT|nr:ADP-ribosylglycohydrolase family protein [Opitutus sp. WL0086]WRQ85941.1 ADP-ribosylglycohydrolase family protein [Opitutus sp. WL0086]